MFTKWKKQRKVDELDLLDAKLARLRGTADASADEVELLEGRRRNLTSEIEDLGKKHPPLKLNEWAGVAGFFVSLGVGAVMVYDKHLGWSGPNLNIGNAVIVEASPDYVASFVGDSMGKPDLDGPRDFMVETTIYNDGARDARIESIELHLGNRDTKDLVQQEYNDGGDRR